MMIISPMQRNIYLLFNHLILFHKLFHEIHINTIINNFIILFHKTRSSS